MWFFKKKNQYQNQQIIDIACHRLLKYVSSRDENGSEIILGKDGRINIKDGICYATFIQNPGADGEKHDSVTSGVVLAVFDLERVQSDSFDPESDIEFYPIGSKGDSCAGHVAASIFKDNSMCLVGDMLYICFSFIAGDSKAHIFQKTFNVRSKAWVDESLVKLRYKGEAYDFSDELINLIYCDNNVEPRAKGLIELVSAWSEYNGEYYNIRDHILPPATLSANCSSPPTE